VVQVDLEVEMSMQELREVTTRKCVSPSGLERDLTLEERRERDLSLLILLQDQPGMCDWCCLLILLQTWNWIWDWDFFLLWDWDRDRDRDFFLLWDWVWVRVRVVDSVLL
jgi:hypothetical protein